jgi:hypothetical protein
MSTRMDRPETDLKPDRTPTQTAVWPWVVLAAVIVIALWWAAVNSANRQLGNNYMPTTPPGAGAPSGTGTTGGGTLQPGPGTGGTGTNVPGGG